MAFDEPLTLVDTHTFIVANGSTVHSHIPLTFYDSPTSDADAPPESMRIVPQAKIIGLLLQTGVERNCLQTKKETAILQIVQLPRGPK